MRDIWEVSYINSQSRERTGYPTQKPLALLHRIIKASSNKNQIVFDPFCGCATAMVAAQQLERKWIGIDIERKAASLVVDRLSDDAGIFKDFVHTNKIPVRTDIKLEKETKNVQERLYTKHEGKCNGCSVEMEQRNLEIDHVIPESKGGPSTYDNYQLLCGNCNRVKGNRTQEYLNAKIAARMSAMQYISFIDSEKNRKKA